MGIIKKLNKTVEYGISACYFNEIKCCHTFSEL